MPAAGERLAVTDEPAPSFESFYRAEHPRLLRVLSAADLSAADALQEAFTKAAMAWPKIATYDDPVAWVRRVAVRVMLNERRSRRRRAAAVERLTSFSGAEGVDRDQLVDLLARAIEGLPRQQRIALSLFYLEGLPSAEVADAMGISDGAVRFHLHQARNALRDALGVSDA